MAGPEPRTPDADHSEAGGRARSAPETGESPPSAKPAPGDTPDLDAEDSVLMRLERMERLLQQAASHLPAIEDLERRLAADMKSRLAQLAADVSRSREETGSLTKPLERIRAQALARVESAESAIMGLIEAARSETLQLVDAARTDASKRIDETRSDLGGQVEAGRADTAERVEATAARLAGQIEAGRADTAERVEATAAQLADRIEASLDRRLRDLAGAIPEAVADRFAELTAEWREEVRTALHDARAATVEQNQILSTQLRAVADAQATLVSTVDRLGKAVREERKATSDALRSTMATAEAALSETTSRFTEELRGQARGTTEELRLKVGEYISQLRLAIEGSLGALRASAEEALSGLRSEVESAGSSVSEEVAGAARDLRDDVDAKASLTESMNAAVARIEGLAEVIESLGQRRGFRQLVESEEELREQQVRLVADLTVAGEGLGKHVANAEQRVDALRESLPALAEQLRSQAAAELASAVEDVRSHLADKLPSDQTLADIRELSAAHQDLDRTSAGLRAEVEGLRQRIEGWGAPRSDARLAGEVTELAGRVDGLEDRVSLQIQRLESIVASVEAHLGRLSEEVPRPRGLFGRRG